MTDWMLVDYYGRLAITLGWQSDNDRPKQTRALWVHPHEKWMEDYYSQFTQVRFVGGNVFMCWSSRTYTDRPLNTDGWEHVFEERMIKPPSKGGKTWRWEWHWGTWKKVPL